MYYSIPVKKEYNLGKITKINLIFKKVNSTDYYFNIYVDNKKIDIEQALRNKQAKHENTYVFHNSIEIISARGGHKNFMYRINHGAGGLFSNIPKDFPAILSYILHDNIYNFSGINTGIKFQYILTHVKFSNINRKTYFKFFIKTHKFSTNR